MKKISYLFFRRLSKTDLDVLTDTAENEGQTYVAIGNKRALFDELGSNALTWHDVGLSEQTTLTIAPVPGSSPLSTQELIVNDQRGARNEIKLAQQRNNGLKQWTDPVRAARPAPDTAYIFLIRDEDGLIHARYAPTIDDLPHALANRLRDQPQTGGLNLASEGGGVVYDSPQVARILRALDARHNVILYGPPGTGKTWLMTEVKKVFEHGPGPSVLFDPADLTAPFKESDVSEQLFGGRIPGHVKFVTFHPSFSYEAFVAGLRPQTQGGELTYEVTSGPLLDLSDAVATSEKAGLMLIDEINRANTAEVFGELITVIEPDKRMDSAGEATPHTITPQLPYAPANACVAAGGVLKMPYHLYFLASMNSVDRTVAPLDSALRRRFEIVEVPPNLSLLEERAVAVARTLTDGDVDAWEELSAISIGLLRELNRRIAVLRGPDFQLGHAFIWDVFEEARLSVQQREQRLLSAFAVKILPQVRELFREQPEDLAILLGGSDNRGRLFDLDMGGDLAAELTVEPLGYVSIRPFPIEGDLTTSMDVLRVIAHHELMASDETADPVAYSEAGHEGAIG